MTRQDRAWQFTKALNRIDEAQVRLSFLLDSVPVSHAENTFTKEGMDGMGYMISDLVATLTKAQKIVKKLAKDPDATMK